MCVCDLCVFVCVCVCVWCETRQDPDTKRFFAKAIKPVTRQPSRMQKIEGVLVVEKPQRSNSNRRRRDVGDSSSSSDNGDESRL